MKRRITAFILLIAILMCSTSLDIVSASVGSSEKSDFNFIESSDLSNIHYTYQENGKKYSVYERYGDSTSEIYTEIYVENKGKEEFVESFVTHIETIDGIMCITQYSEGKIVQKDYINIGCSQPTVNNARNITGTTYSGRVYYDGPTRRYFTGWYYAYSHTGSSLFKLLTYAVVAHVVMELVGLIPGVDPITETLEVIVQAIIAANNPLVYWNKKEYNVNQITYPGMQLYGAPIGGRTYTDLYMDAERTIHIGSEMTEWRNESEWPIGVTIYDA